MHGCRRIAGFTLVELVTILVLVGILAAVAIPRFTGQQDFDALGFHDETLAALRYAQKAAIAERRLVCVAFTASSVTVTIASTYPAAGCDTNLSGPNGSAPYQVSARSGITFSSYPAAGFTFSPSGRPSAAQTIQVSGAASAITVEAETGYVH